MEMQMQIISCFNMMQLHLAGCFLSHLNAQAAILDAFDNTD